jgi:hypothetical protein
MPAAAPAHTPASTTTCSEPSRTRTPNGVYVPAISTKIIEWSSRRSQARARGRQVTRW